MVCLNMSTDLSHATNESKKDTVHYYIMDIAIPTVCCFGTLGNLLNLIVLTRDKIHRVLTKMEKSAHLGLIALALSDLLFCILVLLITTLPSSDRYPARSFMLYLDLVGSPLISIFILTSTWLIVCMAGERYLAVCHPFKARKIISIQKSKLTISLIFLFASLLSIPLFVEKIIATTVCDDNQTWYHVRQRDGYTNLHHSARRLAWSIIADFIPCGALVFFNVCLIVHIQRAKKLRKTMAAHSVNGTSPKHWKLKNSTSNSNMHDRNSDNGLCRRCRDKQMLLKSPKDRHNKTAVCNYQMTELKCQCDSRNMSQRSGSIRNRSHDSALNSVTATLMAIVILFLILVSPSEILKFAACFNRESCLKNKTFLTIRTITNFMQTINFSVNFVLYCAISQPFRDTLHSVFCWCWQRQSETAITSVIVKIQRKSAHSPGSSHS